MGLVISYDTGTQNLYTNQLLSVSRWPPAHSLNKSNFYIGGTSMRETKKNSVWIFFFIT